MWGVREMMQYVERVKNMRERRGRLKKKKMNVSTLMEWLLKISNSSFVQGGPKVPPPLSSRQAPTVWKSDKTFRPPYTRRKFS